MTFGDDQVWKLVDLAPVVQTLNSAIHWINHYPADKCQGNQLRYPAFEQPRPDVDLQLCSGYGEFWNINGTLYSMQRRVPTVFITLRSRLVLAQT